VPAGRHADLTLVKERTPGACGGRDLEIGIFEDHEGVVAAQLQRDPLERAAGSGANLAPDGGRAGERDHGHVGVVGKGGARLGVTGQNVQQAIR